MEVHQLEFACNIAEWKVGNKHQSIFRQLAILLSRYICCLSKANKQRPHLFTTCDNKLIILIIAKC